MLAPHSTYSGRDRARLRRAGRVAAGTLRRAGQILRPGLSTAAIDAFVRRDTRRQRGVPSQLGYHGFPAAVCTSVNAVVCHGIPSPDVLLCAGDIINIDVTTKISGFHGDTSETFIVGGPDAATPEALHVVEVARRCRDAGIAAARPGATMGDIGAAVSALAQREGCSVVREYGGHGIGRQMHEPPHVSHVGRPGEGIRLCEGMVITIEPMVNLGGPELRHLDDGWTVVTADGSLSAQFEHTILLTVDGAVVLTRLS